jgi:phosphate:Na+ symporter
MWALASTGRLLGLADIPAVTLALFHTVFNVLGLLVMWPLSNPLSRFLARRFTTDDELLSRPQYLDRNVLATPDLALEAIARELDRVAAAARENAVAVISAESTGGAAHLRQQGVRALLDAIESFSTDLEIRALPEARRGDLPNVLRICGYLEEISGLVEEVQDHRDDLETLLRSPAFNALTAYQAAVVKHLQACGETPGTEVKVDLEAGYEALRAQYHALKSSLLEDAAQRRVRVERLNQALEGLRDMLKMAEQMTKVAQRLRNLSQVVVTVRAVGPKPVAPEEPPLAESAATAAEGTATVAEAAAAATAGAATAAGVADGDSRGAAEKSEAPGEASADPDAPASKSGG